MRLNSLRVRLALLLAVAAVAGALVQAAITQWPLPQIIVWLDRAAGLRLAAPPPWSLAAILLALAVLLPLIVVASGRVVAPLRLLLRALEGAVLSYRDGDFSLSLVSDRRDEFGELVRLHNALGHALRDQRQHLTERELLLDTVVQNTPVALVLTDPHARVVYANIAARHLLGAGRSLEGSDFAALLAQGTDALRQAVEAGEDTLFGVAIDGADETFHLSQRGFRLQGRPHRLYLFRRMTRELSRQEVATWKRVIRVISHELNNSLAPISSLAHSGAELARRGDHDRRPASSRPSASERVICMVSSTAMRASRSCRARGRTPCPGAVRRRHPRARRLPPHRRAGGGRRWFDAAQIEQALINLLKNAHEAGGPAAEVTLELIATRDEWRLEVADRGPGMTEAVLPRPCCRSTRPSAGTGLGLALAREIAEAHGGRIVLANRAGGGLVVSIVFARKASAALSPRPD